MAQGEQLLSDNVRQVAVVLDRADWGQIIDGLDQRAERWEETARYLRGEPMNDPDELIEECGDDEEAAGIARQYRRIIAAIDGQLDASREGE